MKRNTNTLISQSQAARAFIVAAALLVTACSSGDAEQTTEPPDAIALDASVTDEGFSGEERISEIAVTVAPSTTSVATTTATVSTTTTTEVSTAEEPLAAIPPGDITGATEAPASNLTVATSPGDPLNVRTGPGVSYPILGEFVDGSTGIDATYRYILKSGAVWRFVEDAGTSGWVNSAYLEGVSSTASCIKGADFPEFEGAVAVAEGDVDLDGLIDEVFVLAEPKFEGGYNAWLLVSFGNGGVATGQWSGYFEPTPVAAVHIFNLTTLADPNDPNEIIFSTGQGASHGQWGVAALDGCSVVSTTLDGIEFGFSHGASAGHSTVAGCAYGPHGELEFVITSQNFNTGEWSQSSYQLSNNEWLSLGAYDETDFPAPFEPTPLVLTDCAGVGLSS